MALTIQTILQIAGLESTGRPLSKGSGFEILQVITRDGFGESKATLLYLDSSASYGQLPDLARKARSNGYNISKVVVSSSAKIAVDTARIQKEFPSSVVVTARQLLRNSIRKRVSVATSDAKEVFLNPTIHIGADAPPQSDTGLVATAELIKWLEAPVRPGEPHIGVLLAPPGVGKTTVSEKVARELSVAGKLPVLVHSDRWARLSAISDISLWDVWQSALTADGYVGLTDENSFSACVSEGILIPIFDGFDELCIQRSDHFRAHEVLTAFENLLSEESGKILITVRNSYWLEYIPKEIRDRCWVATLFTFNKPQVLRYFEQSFPGPAEQASRDHALGLLKALQAALPVDDGPNWRKSILGVPAIINLIREASARIRPEDGVVVPKIAVGKDAAVDWVLEYLCERERTRRLYNAPARKQIEMFTAIANDYGDRFKKDVLDLYRSEHLPELAAYPSQIEALTSHPFIEFRGHEYVFKFALVPEHFTSKWLASVLLGLPAVAPDYRFRDVLERHSKGVDSFLEKVAALLIKENDARQAEIIRSAHDQLRASEKGLGKRSYARSGLFHLVLAMAEAKHATGPRLDRTNELLRLFGMSKLRFENFVIEGAVSNLDLSGAEFVGCIFNGSGFIRCKMEGVSFTDCSFEGDLLFDGEIRDVKRSGGALSVEARTAFQGVLDKGALPYTREQFIDCIRDAINQFGMSGRFHPVSGLDRNRGKLNRSPLKTQVWDALERAELIIKEDIGRPGEDGKLYYINPSHTQLIASFLRNGVVAGPIEVALRRIEDAVK